MSVTVSKANLIRSICRESFLEFLKEFWGEVVAEELILNWHIELICTELQKVAERVFLGQPKEYDLVINVPPGSSKSTICSQMFNAWCWTRMPSARFISCSYAQDVSLKDAVRTRDIVQSDLYRACFPEVQLREDTTAKGLFATTEKGDRMSTGVLGRLTGFHGHFITVDDPLNPEESYSEASLKTVNRWLKETLSSRKVDKQVTPTILIMQRLHQADPSGIFLEKEDVRHICLPGEIPEAQDEGEEPIVVSPKSARAKYIDGMLDPKRMPRKVLKEQEIDLGQYGYASQILQNPVPLGGGLFKINKLHLVDQPPRRIVRQYRSWDKAATEKGGAWSVGALIGVDNYGRYWILDIKRDQLGAHEREELIKDTALLDGPDITILVEVEGGSGGKESGQNTVGNLAGYNVIMYHPTGDKEARATPLASQVGGGNVYVLNRHWTKALIEELKFFPRSKYKDQVDALSGGFNRLKRGKIRVGGYRSKATTPTPEPQPA